MASAICTPIVGSRAPFVIAARLNVPIWSTTLLKRCEFAQFVGTQCQFTAITN